MKKKETLVNSSSTENIPQEINNINLSLDSLKSQVININNY